MHRRLGVPPRRSRREGVPSQSPRSRAFARESEGRGAEMRVVVLKLPRRGGDGSPSGTFGPASWPPRPDAPQSGVAQWQSIRLLTEGLWVRVPPPELRRTTRASAFRARALHRSGHRVADVPVDLLAPLGELGHCIPGGDL